MLRGLWWNFWIVAVFQMGADVQQFARVPKLGEAICSPGLSICCLTGQGTKLGPQTSLHWVQSPLPPSESTLAASWTNSALCLTFSLFPVSKINSQLMCCKKNQAKGFFLLLSTLSTNSLPKTKDHAGVRRKTSLVPLQILGRACLPTSVSPPLRPLLPSTNPKSCGMGRIWGTCRGSDQRFCYSLNPDLSLLQLGLVWEGLQASACQIVQWTSWQVRQALPASR